jgi:hypothetical protein
VVLAVLAIVAAGCKLLQRTAQVESTGTATSSDQLQITANNLLELYSSFYERSVKACASKGDCTAFAVPEFGFVKDKLGSYIGGFETQYQAEKAEFFKRQKLKGDEALVAFVARCGTSLKADKSDAEPCEDAKELLFRAKSLLRVKDILKKEKPGITYGEYLEATVYASAVASRDLYYRLLTDPDHQSEVDSMNREQNRTDISHSELLSDFALSIGKAFAPRRFAYFFFDAGGLVSESDLILIAHTFYPLGFATRPEVADGNVHNPLAFIDHDFQHGLVQSSNERDRIINSAINKSACIAKDEIHPLELKQVAINRAKEEKKDESDYLRFYESRLPEATRRYLSRQLKGTEWLLNEIKANHSDSIFDSKNRVALRYLFILSHEDSVSINLCMMAFLADNTNFHNPAKTFLTYNHIFEVLSPRIAEEFESNGKLPPTYIRQPKYSVTDAERAALEKRFKGDTLSEGIDLLHAKLKEATARAKAL